jgi:hypothetical protein
MRLRYQGSDVARGSQHLPEPGAALTLQMEGQATWQEGSDMDREAVRFAFEGYGTLRGNKSAGEPDQRRLRQEDERLLSRET